MDVLISGFVSFFALYDDALAVLPPWFYWCIVVLWGLSLGSFTTCVLYRVPRNISLWRQSGEKQDDGTYRSFCPHCRHALCWKDLIPLFSWFVQMGRCRYCHTPIGIFYPVVELLVLACVLGLGLLFQYQLVFFIISLLVPVLAGLGAFIHARMRR